MSVDIQLMSEMACEAVTALHVTFVSVDIVKIKNILSNHVTNSSKTRPPDERNERYINSLYRVMEVNSGNIYLYF